MAKKRRHSGKKRTITPEHLAKMQEGRRRAKVHRERLAALKEKGMDQDRFEEFLDYAELLSARAEEEMRDGNVAPSPYGDACVYCKCLGACGFTGAPRKEESVRCADIVSVVKRAKEGV